MPVRYTSEARDDYLHVVTEGSFHSVADFLDHVENIHRELAELGLDKILVNETKCHTHIDLDGLGELSRALKEQKRFARKPRVAVVSLDINYPLLQHVFVAKEKIRIFTDDKAAAEWLADD